MAIVPNNLIGAIKHREDFKSEPLHVSNDAACRMDFVFEQSHRAYPENDVERAESKAFWNEEHFVAWGTEVDSPTGRVGTPIEKRQALMQACNLKHVSKGLLEQALGLVVHPFMHRRVLMSSLHHIYKWMGGLERDRMYRLPPHCIDDLLAVILGL